MSNTYTTRQGETVDLACLAHYGRTEKVVEADLIGARGATPQDQRKIDLTVVGICAVDGIWTRAECAKHGNGK